MNEKGAHPVWKKSRGPFTLVKKRTVRQIPHAEQTAEDFWYEIHWRGGKYGGRGVMFQKLPGKLEWDFWVGEF